MEDLRAEGEFETSKLVRILRVVETKEDLQKSLPKIKKRLNRIATLAVSVRSVADKSGGSLEPSTSGDELFVELARLYELPGCRDLLESAQSESISLLNR
jgi:hypothetical protein